MSLFRSFSFPVALLLLSQSPAWAVRVRPAARYIEFFGSAKVSEGDVRNRFSKEIEKLLFAQARSATRSSSEAQKLEKTLEDGVKEMGDFAWVRLHLVKLDWNEKQMPMLFQFEVIEKKDMATRLPFRSPPQSDVPDSGRLIEKWGQYEALGRKFEDSSETVIERPKCRAFYCVWGGLTPELGKLEAEFVANVPAYRDNLVLIMQQHPDPVWRKRAIFLLSYLKDGSEVSNHAAYGLMDPDSDVRDAAISVLNDLTVYHQDVPIAIHEIHRLLDVPYPSDRTKALALMLNLSDNPNYRDFLLKTASKQILKLLRVRYPNNHDMAYTVLSLLSGESFGARDYDAWDRWIWKARQEGGKKE